MNQVENEADKINRRHFITRVTKACLSIAGACALGYFFYDPNGPKGSQDESLVSVPDFSMPEVGKKMAVVRGSSRRETLPKAFEAIGGIETFIKRGDRVLLKVNAAFASPPMLSATTHPDLIAQCIELCYRAGAEKVFVTDNPINDPAACFNLSGIESAVKSAGGKLVFPKNNYFRSTSVKGGSLIQNWPLLFEPLDGITKLIGMTPVKSHQRSGASMTMKNWYGLLGGHRNIFHQDIHNTIKELSMMVKPTLVILDGTTAMMTNGPTGGALSDLKNTETMIVSTDQVAADAFGCSLLNLEVRDLPYISKAAEAGSGTADYESLKPVII
ncbi:DUF362 domain-containing protein [Deltaproteobacteria bacterium]|nr:DUF362 domain-containing protein [Deltaproteobacteria bacterium]